MKHNILITFLVILTLVVIGLIAYAALKPDRAIAPVATEQKIVTQKSQMQSAQNNTQQKDAAQEQLTQKWTLQGLTDWKREVLTQSDIELLLPKQLSIGQLKESLFTNEVYHGELQIAKGARGIGVITTFKEKMAGDSDIISFVKKQGKLMHEEYCKQNGTEDMRFDKNDGMCHTDIVIIQKIGPNTVRWNNNFIGSPDTISVVLASGSVLNINLAQDMPTKEDLGFDVEELITDILEFAAEQPVQNEVKKIGSEIVNVDEYWNLYTNHTLGFSMKIPKRNYRQDTDPEHDDPIEISERKCFGDMSVVAISDDQTGRVYIGTTNVMCDQNGKDVCMPFNFNSYNNSCYGGIVLTVYQMKNDENALNEIFAQRSGYEGCVANGVKLQDGRIDIEKYVANLRTDACFLSHEIFANYSAKNQKLVLSDLGHDIFFLSKLEVQGKSDVYSETSLQNSMFDSFKFD